jgi:hypothetical protein
VSKHFLRHDGALSTTGLRSRTVMLMKGKRNARRKGHVIKGSMVKKTFHHKKEIKRT